MKKQLFSVLSSLRRFLRALGIAQLVIKVPFVSRFFWAAYGYLRPKDDAMVAVKDFGFRLYLDSRDTYLACTLLMLGHYEPVASRIFSSLLKEGMTVVDIGAQVGYYTVLSAMRVGPSGKVFAFEPEPKHFRLLRRNLSANGLTNVFVEQKALLDQSGMQHFYLASENLGRHGIYRQDDSVEQIEVETTTLDRFFSNRQEKVQVIKLDAEGAEPLILKGMKRVISESSSLALFTEFFLPNLEAGGHSPEAYLNDLVRHGFTLHLMDEEQKSVGKVDAGQMLEICRAQPELVRNLLCTKRWDL
jgi:FkbM family methyltransferase